MRARRWTADELSGVTARNGAGTNGGRRLGIFCAARSIQPAMAPRRCSFIILTILLLCPSAAAAKANGKAGGKNGGKSKGGKGSGEAKMQRCTTYINWMQRVGLKEHPERASRSSNGVDDRLLVLTHCGLDSRVLSSQASRASRPTAVAP